MKRFFACFLAALMVATLAACGGTTETSSSEAAASGSEGSSAAEESAETIKIGCLAPLTGEVSVYGIATSNGIQMGVDEINAAGGINGKQIELITLDEKGDPTEAVNAYNSLVDQGVVAIIGDVTSKPCIAVAELAAVDNMPMLTATGTAAEITTIGSNIFRTCFMDPFQGQIMATFAADNLGATKVAVMYDTGSDYSQGLADSFKAQAEAKGMTVTAFEGYATADTDFTAILNKIIATEPDAIFVPDYYGDVSLILNQARTAGYTGAMLGGDGWDGVLGALPADKLDVANNGYFSNHYSTADEAAASFLSKYKELFGLDGNAFAALGYDSAYIMADAIERAGSTDAQAIIDALAATDIQCVTGHITFDENGDPIKDVAVTKFVDGKTELAAKVSA
jgi:branched-chain amino acid transport system substrate-binding protein